MEKNGKGWKRMEKNGKGQNLTEKNGKNGKGLWKENTGKGRDQHREGRKRIQYRNHTLSVFLRINLDNPAQRNTLN